MGYMGFGMQKWIYAMRARKPFEMNRKKSFTALSKHKREFKIQYSEKKESFHIGIVLFILIVFILYTLLPNWHEYEKERISQEMTHTTELDNRAFNFLKKSGLQRLKSKNYVGALSEFKLAQKIKPHSEEINLLLFETISILCEKDERYCSDFEILQF
ncbi:MAG: hypothetical protein HRU50_03550 [Winogradskyella sp.]|uniref:hypothetical protein n=1 Tax=Winogradskyella sp. TaxID=1883156 RepID=UPI0025D1FCA8|nr:hypothetical protein [Winogradskyella sp.]NRB59001.1 hypothetical protein [Winogradskyella sp.]